MDLVDATSKREQTQSDTKQVGAQVQEQLKSVQLGGILSIYEALSKNPKTVENKIGTGLRQVSLVEVLFDTYCSAISVFFYNS